MKRFIPIVTCLIFLFSCNGPKPDHIVWTQAYEAKLYRQLDQELKPRMPDDYHRNDLILFIIKGLKADLPNGVESVPSDSIYPLKRQTREGI